MNSYYFYQLFDRMKNRNIILFISFFLYLTNGYCQPYVVNEKIEKIFSEGFTDFNDNFESTSSSDRKFWGKYADGYYYMERKLPSPRAIVVKTEDVNKNFSIKTKLTLGPLGGMDASVGIMYLVQSSGRGGFVFEINKKRSFRITDLGTSAYITKEGNDGWIRSKNIAPATRSNTIELKSFRGKFDIFINGFYIYSYINDSYKKGKFGAYIGPRSAASLYYFNVYQLDIPGAEPEINLADLQDQLSILKVENDSLKRLALQAKYGGNDDAAISAIQILEDQLKTVNEENQQLKNLLTDYETAEPASNPEEIKKDQTAMNTLAEKIDALSSERDSIFNYSSSLKNKLFQTAFQRDSLRAVNLKMEKKINFLEEHIQEVQVKIDEIEREKNNPLSMVQNEKQTTKEDTIDTKPPLAPSEIVNASEIAVTLPTGSDASPLELIEKDSTYDHTLDLDAIFSESDNKSSHVNDSSQTQVSDSTDQSTVADLSLSTESIIDSIPKLKKDSVQHPLKTTEEINPVVDTLNISEVNTNPVDTLEQIKKLIPLPKQKIKVKKAVKGAFKD
tara:strand:+ start:13542 stop:15224 length:1683 start_codon:yes stop_codon:yes gene_type:complete